MLHKLAFVVPGGYSVRPYLHKLRGVRLGSKVWISQMVYIDELHPEAVEIGDNSSLGIRSSVITHFYWGAKKSADAAGKVTIGKDVFVGPHCVVLPNVTIGDGSVITAGTVVSRNVPAGVVWTTDSAAPAARASVPLTHETSYEQFTAGLRPFR